MSPESTNVTMDVEKGADGPQTEVFQKGTTHNPFSCKPIGTLLKKAQEILTIHTVFHGCHCTVCR